MHNVNSTPLVSVIMPAYNASITIEEAICSVIDQDYNNWELIIVNDNSQDDTSQIGKRFSVFDHRIRIIDNENNMGVAKSRNIALSNAKGEYIAFLDSDDMWKKDKLSKQISFMMKNKVAISYSYYAMVDSKTKKTIKVVKCPKTATPNSILKSNYMGCLTVVVNRAITGDFEMPLLDFGEDMVTWYTLMRRGFKAFCIPEVLGLYRITDSSASSNKKRTAKKQWSIYREYLHIPFLVSCYYFLFYCIRGFLKHL